MFNKFKDKWLSAKNLDFMANAIGWLGSALLLLAYLLVSNKMVSGTSWLYQWMNVAGSVAFILLGIYRRVPQTITINTVWLIIGVVAMWQVYCHH